MYSNASSCVINPFASIIEAFKPKSIFFIFSSFMFNKIMLQISLSDIIPNALNTINNGIGFLILGISKYIGCPKPLFLESITILICFGEIHLKSGIDFTSACHAHLLFTFLILKHIILFSAALSCPITVFSLPLIIKYPPGSYLHSPVIF